MATKKKKGEHRTRGASEAAMKPRALKRLRIKMEMSQASLAKKLGVSPLTIYLWESGRVPIAKSRALAVEMVATQEGAM